jgi:acyl-CoA synthetase (AMP-forming)/AMP-acid ligase II
MLGTIYKGNSMVILRNFDPASTWSLIEEERITTTLAVPAMLAFMLQVPDFERFDWSSLRYVTSGAAPVPVTTINTYMELGIEIHQVYGPPGSPSSTPRYASLTVRVTTCRRGKRERCWCAAPTS